MQAAVASSVMATANETQVHQKRPIYVKGTLKNRPLLFTERELQVAVACSVTARVNETQMYQKRPVRVKRDIKTDLD